MKTAFAFPAESRRRLWSPRGFSTDETHSIMINYGKQTYGPFNFIRHMMQGRSFPLMVSLIILLLFYPLFESPTNTLPDWPARLLFSLVPISGVVVLHGQRWSFLSLIVLGIGVLILDSIPDLRVGSLTFWLRALASVGMYGFCTTLIVRSVFIRDDLKDHPVYGGIDVGEALRLGLHLSAAPVETSVRLCACQLARQRQQACELRRMAVGIAEDQ